MSYPFVYFTYQFYSSEVVHQREREPPLTQVLQRGSYVVHLVVDEQETVVSTVEVLHHDGGVLCVVSVRRRRFPPQVAKMCEQRNLFSL